MALGRLSFFIIVVIIIVISFFQWPSSMKVPRVKGMARYRKDIALA